MTNRIIGILEDEEAKMGLLMYFIPLSQNKEAKTEIFIKEKIWKYFTEGKIVLGYDSKRKCIITIPEVAEIMRKDGIIE